MLKITLRNVDIFFVGDALCVGRFEHGRRVLDLRVGMHACMVCMGV